MTFIPVNFDDAQEPKPAAAGQYMLQIVKAEVAETGPQSKHPGSPQLKISIGFVDEPNTPNIMQFISLPNEHDDANSASYKALLLKRFLVHFKIPFDSAGIDTEKVCMEAIGCKASTEVSLDTPTESGDVYNRIKIPKLRDEGQSASKPRGRR
jgi:hypothetical protein